MRRAWLTGVCALIVVASACGGSSKTPTGPTPVVNPKLTAPTPDSPADGEQLATLRPTLTVRNGVSDQPGARTYEFQISDTSEFASATTQQIVTFFSSLNKTGIPEDASGKTSFTPDADLQPTTRFFWRARMVQGSTTSEWSPVAKFKSKLVGFLRAGELYDPLIHGETVGVIVGDATFIPGKGLKLNSAGSYVKYLLPETVTAGEFSMEVEGLRANAPGNKTKVYGMQQGQDDFITNDYRVDIQYRGSDGVPPNCIQWRALFGSDDFKYEPSTAQRFASVFLLDPNRTYFWKSTWGGEFRTTVQDGGIDGSTLYDIGLPVSETYRPNPHYAYLGAPSGRSGIESASIAGAIYRNVWLGRQPRPTSLGSALRER